MDSTKDVEGKGFSYCSAQCFQRQTGFTGPGTISNSGISPRIDQAWIAKRRDKMQLGSELAQLFEHGSNFGSFKATLSHLTT